MARVRTATRFPLRRPMYGLEIPDVTVPGVTIAALPDPAFQQILTPEATSFLAELERTFGAERLRLLAARQERQKRLDAGEKPDFPEETAHIRAGDWKVAPLPKDLLDRRIEITGPVDRKMVINA